MSMAMLDGVLGTRGLRCVCRQAYPRLKPFRWLECCKLLHGAHMDWRGGVLYVGV